MEAVDDGCFLVIDATAQMPTTTLVPPATSTIKARRKPGKKLILDDVPDDQLDPDELRKRRNRIKSMRSYYSRKAKAEGLTQQVVELEKMYAHMLQEKNAATEQALLSLDNILEFPEKLLDVHSLQNVLMKLFNARQSLIREHQLLKSQVRAHMKVQGRIGVMLDQLHTDAAETERQRMLVKLKVPLSVDECYEIGRKAYEMVSTFLREKESLPVVDRMVAYDWRLRNYKDGKMLCFLVDKRFQFYSAVDLVARAWSTVRTKEQWERLYSSSINIHLFDVQIINDDNVVLARINDRSDHGVSFKSVFLLTRFQVHEHAYMVVMRGLEQDRVECEMRGGDKWWNIFSWFIIEEEIEDGRMTGVCKFTFGGAKPLAVGARLEPLLLLLRWESIAIGPLIELPGDGDDLFSDDSKSSAPSSPSVATQPTSPVRQTSLSGSLPASTPSPVLSSSSSMP